MSTPTDTQLGLRRAEARNKSIDHTHYYPMPAQVLLDNAGDGYEIGEGLTATSAAPTLVTQFIDANGHYIVDVDVVSEARAVGQLSVYVWNDQYDAVILMQVVDFDTAEGAVYRIEVAGRKFHVQLSALTTSTEPVFLSYILS